MQTSRFQLGLIATLAVGLGFSLASSDAVGYPAGAAVSMGSNPVWNHAGEIANNSTVTLATAPADQDLMLTDLFIQTQGSLYVSLLLDDDSMVGRYYAWGAVHNDGGGNSPINQQFTSPIRVPAGQSLRLVNCNCGSTAFYNTHGYYAQP